MAGERTRSVLVLNFGGMHWQHEGIDDEEIQEND
jgi:hypothetical protein